MEILSFIILLLVIYGSIVWWRLFLNIKEIYKKETGKNIFYGWAGIVVWKAIFINKYKENKTCNNLIWQLRILIPLIIILCLILTAL